MLGLGFTILLRIPLGGKRRIMTFKQRLINKIIKFLRNPFIYFYLLIASIGTTLIVLFAEENALEYILIIVGFGLSIITNVIHQKTGI